MMSTNRRFRPRLDVLEDRTVPTITSATFYGGTLTVVGNSVGTTMSLNATAPNAWRLAQGATTIGLYSGVSNVNIRLGNAADNVTINPATFTSGTNFTITTGYGTDTVNFNATGGTGVLGGRISVTESGGGSVNIGTTANTTLNGQVTISGSAGANTTLTVGSVAPSSGVLNGTLSASYVNTIVLAGASSLNNVTVSDGATGLNTAFTQVVGTLIKGNLSFTGGSGANLLTLAGTTLGSVLFNSFGSGTLDASGATVNGALTFNGGDGNNNILTTTTTTFNNNVTIKLGNGTNTYALKQFSIAGSLSITAGNGTNDIGAGFATSASTIGGNVTVKLGNGTNTFSIPSSLVILGSTVSYTGGSGADTVTVASAVGSSAYNLSISLGGAGIGTDTANLGGLTAVSPIGDILVTFGLFGTKALVAPGAGSFVSFTVVNP